MARTMSWGSGPTSTPTRTPSRTNKSTARSKNSQTIKSAVSRDANKARRSSPVTKLLMSEGKFTLQQLRDMGFDVSVIPSNPTSNSITTRESINALDNNYPFVGAGANMASTLTKMIAGKNQKENTNPFQPSPSGRGGPVRYGDMNNKLGVDELRKYLGIGQQASGYADNWAGTGTPEGTLGEFLRYDRATTENYLNSLYGGGQESPLYWGGYGGYGGSGGSSYTPFDFFFNLLNWRI